MNSAHERLCIFQTSHPKVLDVYNSQKNYLVENNPMSSANCMIYFSGNGLYYPNTEDAFTKTIIKENRFEWQRFKRKDVKKTIFVRDIFKQWYVKGINSSLNTVEKVADFLRDQTQGLRVTTVGSSAGGYAAVLFGLLINADFVLAFSPQFSIYSAMTEEDAEEKNPFIFEFMDDENVSRYYDLRPLIQTTDTDIFYFLPARNTGDIQQMEHVKDLPNVFVTRIKWDEHGIPFHKFNLPDILNKPKEDLIQIANSFKCREISTFEFSLKMSGLLKTLKWFKAEYCRRKKMKTTGNYSERQLA